MKKYALGFLFFILCLINLFPQQGFVHETSQEYVWPTDKNVLEKLDRWQDLKFGVLFHWGLYSVPGIVESWSICSEDEGWIPRDSTIAYDEYKKWYWGLISRFNPTQFNPEQWAQATKDGGMKYMIFTTKHHDSFNLFDTKQTDSFANATASAILLWVVSRMAHPLAYFTVADGTIFLIPSSTVIVLLSSCGAV
jgi:alpha-L-fucosidase